MANMAKATGAHHACHRNASQVPIRQSLRTRRWLCPRIYEPCPDSSKLIHSCQQKGLADEHFSSADQHMG